MEKNVMVTLPRHASVGLGFASHILFVEVIDRMKTIEMVGTPSG